jgi:hypothetical protein
MPLQKTIYTTDNTGVSATYWCACDINLDFHKKHGSIELMGYINQQAYVDGRNPVIVKEYEVRMEVFDSYFSEQVLGMQGVNSRTQAYLYVKDHSGEFNDAEIVS